MRESLLFMVIVLVSGASAGLIHGMINFAVVEPYLDQATMIEGRNIMAAGDVQDATKFWAEYEGYRVWQKGGQILAGVILGTSIGSLYGIVFALSKDALPGRGHIQKALVLAGVMYVVLYVVPFLKYPPSLPGTGSEETIMFRTVLYLVVVAVSGFGAVGFYKISKLLRGHAKLFSLAGYCVMVCTMLIIMPDSSDMETISSSDGMLNEFRMASAAGVAFFWASAGVLLGLFWGRLHSYRQKTSPSYK